MTWGPPILVAKTKGYQYNKVKDNYSLIDHVLRKLSFLKNNQKNI